MACAHVKTCPCEETNTPVHQVDVEGSETKSMDLETRSTTFRLRLLVVLTEESGDENNVGT